MGFRRKKRKLKKEHVASDVTRNPEQMLEIWRLRAYLRLQVRTLCLHQIATLSKWKADRLQDRSLGSRRVEKPGNHRFATREPRESRGSRGAVSGEEAGVFASTWRPCLRDLLNQPFLGQRTSHGPRSMASLRLATFFGPSTTPLRTVTLRRWSC